MKTLVSATAFGWLSLPPADELETSRNKPRGKCEFPRIPCARRPILKRLATEEELASIRKELEAIDAKFRQLPRASRRPPCLHSSSRKPQRRRAGISPLDA